jgi:hypothetical protein
MLNPFFIAHAKHSAWLMVLRLMELLLLFFLLSFRSASGVPNKRSLLVGVVAEESASPLRHKS